MTSLQSLGHALYVHEILNLALKLQFPVTESVSEIPSLNLIQRPDRIVLSPQVQSTCTSSAFYMVCNQRRIQDLKLVRGGAIGFENVAPGGGILQKYIQNYYYS